MAQFDLDTPIDANTKNGTQLADDLSGTGKWRDALHSLHKGSSAPSYIQAGMMWIDDTNAPIWDIYVYDGTDNILVKQLNITDNLDLDRVFSLWDTNITYAIGDYVKGSDNSLYRALISQSGNDPVPTPAPNWVQIATDHPTATTTVKGISLLPKRIILTHITTPNPDRVSFAAGVMQFDDGSGCAPTPTYIKLLQGTGWTAGNNGEGLDASSVITVGAWYKCFAIYNPTLDIADYIYTTSAVPTPLPSGYTKQEYIGSVQYQAIVTIRPFIQAEKYFYLDDIVTDINVNNPGAAATNYALTIPSGFSVIPLFNVTLRRTVATTCYGMVYSPLVADPVPTAILHNLATDDNDSEYSTFNGLVLSNTASQIRIILTSTNINTDLIISTQGWIDQNLGY